MKEIQGIDVASPTAIESFGNIMLKCVAHAFAILRGFLPMLISEWILTLRRFASAWKLYRAYQTQYEAAVHLLGKMDIPAVKKCALDPLLPLVRIGSNPVAFAV